ncbi:alcohol dehydrogenase catalytic domain-containing protein [Pseudarthrobacter sp. fls2-241-R2A-168]|uniref:zinc-dependent alcohol dehydrogenase n=1 Tax=Pseudarthrobacter sp. fls2-241-R2A-168 TaxID=3040304 RepID=UPI0025556AE5|nr:alcohol dehydrogenase catalytic domain-containing protein [Pseudarthrobacter sp. fls2-241-R2A-168]
MAQTAKAVVFEGPEKFVLRELPLPDIGPEELMVEVLLCGVDGSEVHMFRGEVAWMNAAAPVIFGDEIVGRVAVIGNGARQKRGLDVGDRVIVEARWGCNQCRPCIKGHYYLCRKNRVPVMTGYGVMNLDRAPGLWGGYATHAYVPAEAIVHKVPDGMDSKTALIASGVLANGLRWSSFGDIGLGTRVAVVGPGPQGLCTVLAAARRGAQVVSIGLESDAERLAVAKRFGAVETIAIAPGEDAATTRDRVIAAMGPIDVAIDVAGYAPAKELALSLPQVLGAVVSPAVATPHVQPVDFMHMLRNEITMFAPNSHPHSVKPALELAAQLLDEGIDLGEFVSHVYPLEAAEEAIRVTGGETDERPIKTALDPTLSA